MVPVGIVMKYLGRYNWKHQTVKLIYIGRKGIWHQFVKVEEPRIVWCEVRTEDLHQLEETE